VHKLAVLSEVTKRVLVVMVEPDEKRDGLTRAYCVDPDCYVTESWRVVFDSNPFEEVRVCEAEKSGFMNSTRNPSPLSSANYDPVPKCHSA
jgi:hypothetical protein